MQKENIIDTNGKYNAFIKFMSLGISKVALIEGKSGTGKTAIPETFATNPMIIDCSTNPNLIKVLGEYLCSPMDLCLFKSFGCLRKNIQGKIADILAKYPKLVVITTNDYYNLSPKIKKVGKKFTFKQPTAKDKFDYLQNHLDKSVSRSMLIKIAHNCRNYWHLKQACTNNIYNFGEDTELNTFDETKQILDSDPNDDLHITTPQTLLSYWIMHNTNDKDICGMAIRSQKKYFEKIIQCCKPKSNRIIFPKF